MPIYADLAVGKVLVAVNPTTVGLIVPETSPIAFGVVDQLAATGTPLYALEDVVGYNKEDAMEIVYNGNVYFLLDEADILFKETTVP